jgi:hypothetical protein
MREKKGKTKMEELRKEREEVEEIKIIRKET